MIRNNIVVYFLFIISAFWSQIKVGTWYGTLDVMGQKLPLVLHLKDSLGLWKGTMDSPKQNAYGMPMSAIKVEDKSLNFSIDNLKVTYQGQISEGFTIIGEFKQGVFKTHLSFSQSELEFTKTVRKQDPVEPYPYMQDEVEVLNIEGGFTLRGSLTHPENEKMKKTACIILITGSGPQDRNEEILDHRPFLVLADKLTRAGYSVLRLDDRGIGKSEGNFNGATSLDFVQDIESAIEYAKKVPFIDDKKIILMGHSEGGMIANMVAAKHQEIYGVVSLAGPGVLGSSLLVEQQLLISKAMGASQKQLKDLRKFCDSFYPLLTLDSMVIVRKKAELFLTEYSKKINKKELRESGIKDRAEWIKINLETYVNPWMLYFLNYEPSKDLQKISCHYLAINGTNDLQVPVDMNLNAISKNCNPGPGKVKEITRLNGLNHLFQPSTTGNPSEYGSIEITIDDSAMQVVLNFLDRILN